MKDLGITGLSVEDTRGAVLAWLGIDAPAAKTAVHAAHGLIVEGKRKKSIADYQALALYGLARQYDAPGERILELGTYYGFSAAILHLAAPNAWVDTLNPTKHEAEAASRNLLSLDRTTVWAAASWDWLKAGEGAGEFGLVFVDGDHNAVGRDAPWFNRLREGGLILFHDYTPATSKVHPCEPVYQAVNQLAEHLGRSPDVLLVDDSTYGMAGFYRRVSETVPG